MHNCDIDETILGMALMTDVEAIDSLIKGMKIIVETANDMDTYICHTRQLDDLIITREQCIIQHN